MVGWTTALYMYAERTSVEMKLKHISYNLYLSEKQINTMFKI